MDFDDYVRRGSSADRFPDGEANMVPCRFGGTWLLLPEAPPGMRPSSRLGRDPSPSQAKRVRHRREISSEAVPV